MRVYKNLTSLIFILLLTGCVYKIEIQQGNLISPEQADDLVLGMTEQEVLETLGTPLIQDPFSPGRWDYVYSLQERGELIEERRLTVFFNEEERLVKIEREETKLVLE